MYNVILVSMFIAYVYMRAYI